MGAWTTVAQTAELAPGQAKAIESNGHAIALLNVDGTYYAIGNECTHVGGPLAEGSVAGGMVTCPWHGASFDVQTGKVLSPPAAEDVPTYPVRVEGTEIQIELP